MSSSGFERASLEHEEREAAAGQSDPKLHARLMMAYLINEQMCECKFLWQRIPASSKESHPELAHLWAVGAALYRKDPPAVHKAIEEKAWPEYLQEGVNKLKEGLLTRYLSLVSAAYSSISLSDFAAYVGLPGRTEEALALARAQPDWRVEEDKGLVWPADKPQPCLRPKPAEEKLAQLTEFIAFLEK